MRQQFIETQNCNDAENQMPWAVIIVPVDGGIIGFESEYGAYCRLYGLTPELSAEMKAERIYPIDVGL